MDLARLQTFQTVLDKRSFSRAAAALGCTQSTVSFHIRALEQELDATLLDRKRGQVRATAAGKLLLPYARRMAALASEARARLREEESGEAGRLRIAASTVPGEYLLPPLLAQFRAQHPAVSFAIHISDSRRALAGLLAGDCDLALVGARVPDRRLSYQPFADDEIILVAAPHLPEARLRKLTSAQLRRAPLLLREEGSGTRLATRGFERRDADAAPVIEVGSTEGLKRCAIAGLGVALLSRHAAQDALADQRLVHVGAPGTPVRRRFYAARLTAAPMPATARSFFSMLRI
jgi:DNA-binding transcriptional LysR family regulator